MKRYEYRTLSTDDAVERGDVPADGQLTNLGQQGWLVSQVVSTSRGQYYGIRHHYVLERELVPEVAEAWRPNTPNAGPTQEERARFGTPAESVADALARLGKPASATVFGDWTEIARLQAIEAAAKAWFNKGVSPTTVHVALTMILNGQYGIQRFKVLRRVLGSARWR